MVYRSSRRPPSSDDEARNLQESTSFDSGDSDKDVKFRNQAGPWVLIAIIFIVLSLGLLIGIIVLKSGNAEDKIPLCGAGSSSIKRVMDLSEPDKPGPFHDLTVKEIKSILSFLEKDPSIKLKPAVEAKWSDSVVHTMELLPPKKSKVEAYLSGKESQPERQARVILFRRDMEPAVVQEVACGPLPDVIQCPLIESKSRRNNIEYTMRPILNPQEVSDIYKILFPKIDDEIGHIIRESFGAAFADCQGRECLKFYPGPVGSNIVKDVNIRHMWLTIFYDVEYYGGYPLDLGLLVDLSSVNPAEHNIIKVWYNQQFFETVEDFISQYDQNILQKITTAPPNVEPKDSFSSLYQRGEPVPKEPQRPPILVEPDGKRYSVKHREVEYLGWKFNFRMSPVTGPVINDVRYRGDRIAFEIALNEIAVFYSSFNPKQRNTDYTDSGAMMGMMSRSLIPGADCPDTATFISQTFPSQFQSEPLVFKRGWCLFESNNGYPTRRHLSYARLEGGFYGGMLDTSLILRSIQTVGNYDYVVDFMFYQTGAIQTRVLSTGYILPAVYSKDESQYGWRTFANFTAPLHHHIFSFKVDLDISGTSNRYETLDVKSEKVLLRHPHNREYHQTKFDRSLKRTEKEALYNFDFDHPKYHIVHNNAQKTNLGQPKAYRIHLNGMSKQLVTPNTGNEASISWARHQLVVTKHKDDEQSSTSPYGMYDSLNPVTDFSKYYEDDENLVDEDLVFWIPCGIHHIPHTEDLPVTPTVGAQLGFFLLPYNYFPHCPSVNSRDHVRVHLKDKKDPSKGVKVERHGYKDEQCRVPKYATEFDELLQREPDVAVEA